MLAVARSVAPALGVNMQSANAAAPKILDALRILGQAKEEHISFAMLGLPSHLQKAARDAAATLRPVADRLRSRKIATELRIQVSSLLAASKHAHVLTPLDLSSPHTFPLGNGDLLYVLLEHCSLVSDWPVRCQQHYRLASVLAQLSCGWSSAVREWRQEDCRLTLLGGSPSDHSEASSLARLSGPSAVDLQLHGNFWAEGDGHPLDLRADQLVALCLRFPRLQRLLIRYSDDLQVATLVSIINALPALKVVDASHSYLPGQSGDLFEALVARPQIRLFVTACSAVYKRSRVWRGSEYDEDGDIEQASLSPSLETKKSKLLKEQVVCVTCLAAGRPESDTYHCHSCAARPEAIPIRYGWAAWQHPYPEANGSCRSLSVLDASHAATPVPRSHGSGLA